MQKVNSPPRFFPISQLKFVLLSVATFGFYQIYWFYKHWQLIRAHSREAMIEPFWRAFFFIAYCLPLLRRVKHTATLRGIKTNFNPILQTLTWIILFLCIQLPSPYYLISILSVLVLLPVQRAANCIIEATVPGEDRNGHFSILNLLTLCAGGVLWALELRGVIAA